MKKAVKKKLCLGVHAALITALVFSLLFTAVSAWYYRDSSQDLLLNPAHFGVSIYIDGSAEETKIKYTLPAATILTFDSDILPYPEYKDTMFNACVRRSLISIRNYGEIAINAVLGIEVTEAVTTYTDAGGTEHEIKLVKAAGQTIESLKCAIIAKNFGALGIPPDDDIIMDGSYPDYRAYIDLQMNKPGGGRFASLTEMNTSLLKNTPIDPEKFAHFTLALWADYEDLCREFGYAPESGIVRSTEYTVTITAQAENVKPE